MRIANTGRIAGARSAEQSMAFMCGAPTHEFFIIVSNYLIPWSYGMPRNDLVLPLHLQDFL